VSAPGFEAAPINVRPASWQTVSYGLSPKGETKLNLGTDEEPVILTTPKGVSSLILQERRCGDVYAEINGPKLCKSTTAPDTLAAVQAIFEQVPA
jgi:hypothetical protein